MWYVFFSQPKTVLCALGPIYMLWGYLVRDISGFKRTGSTCITDQCFWYLPGVFLGGGVPFLYCLKEVYIDNQMYLVLGSILFREIYLRKAGLAVCFVSLELNLCLSSWLWITQVDFLYKMYLLTDLCKRPDFSRQLAVVQLKAAISCLKTCSF